MTKSLLLLGTMGYESVSTIVVLAILVIVMVGWLPGKTVDSMSRVIERRQDRFSSSLHLVDENSGMRFSDGRTHMVKGAVMQPQQSRGSEASREHIAQVRKLRREAIRRRRILVIALVALVFAVFGLSFVWHYDPLFALIPLLLVALVLGLGVRASRQAREWEQRVAARRTGSARRRSVPEVGTSTASSERKGLNAEQSAHAEPDERNHSDVPTDVMEQREIRRALRRAQEEGRAARLQHQAHASSSSAGAKAKAAASQVASGEVGSAEAKAEGTVPAVAQPSAAESSAAQAAAGTQEPVESKVDSKKDAGVAAEAVLGQPEIGHAHDAVDATSELERIHAAPALDVFDMATQQDLISFSLGAPRNIEQEAPSAPESLEIKSMRQVAKAVPQHSAQNEDAAARHDGAAASDAAPANDAAPTNDSVPTGDSTSAGVAVSQHAAAAPADDAGQAPAAQKEPAQDSSQTALQTTDRPVNDARAFHRAEVEADIEVPDATSDSLGSDIEAVLARRVS